MNDRSNLCIECGKNKKSFQLYYCSHKCYKATRERRQQSGGKDYLITYKDHKKEKLFEFCGKLIPTT